MVIKHIGIEEESNSSYFVCVQPHHMHMACLPYQFDSKCVKELPSKTQYKQPLHPVYLSQNIFNAIVIQCRLWARQILLSSFERPLFQQKLSFVRDGMTPRNKNVSTTIGLVKKYYHKWIRYKVVNAFEWIIEPYTSLKESWGRLKDQQQRGKERWEGSLCFKPHSLAHRERERERMRERMRENEWERKRRARGPSRAIQPSCDIWLERMHSRLQRENCYSVAFQELQINLHFSLCLQSSNKRILISEIKTHERFSSLSHCFTRSSQQ